LEVLGDEYISQHILQSYHDYLEQTSYKVYMSDMAKNIFSMVSGTEQETSWRDVLNDLDQGLSYEKPQTESEEEVKSRMLSKLKGKEGA
jgi:hypothetical protein